MELEYQRLRKYCAFVSSIFRASKDISGLVKVMVTSPAGLIKFFLMLSPGRLKAQVVSNK